MIGRKNLKLHMFGNPLHRATSSSPLDLTHHSQALIDSKNDDDLREVFRNALEHKLAFFDTAEFYGSGRSEELIGKFRDELCTTPQKKGNQLSSPANLQHYRGAVERGCCESTRRGWC